VLKDAGGWGDALAKSQAMTTYLTPSQAARRLGLSTERVRQLARSGVLHPELTPLGRLYRVDDIDGLVAERSAATASTDEADDGA